MRYGLCDVPGFGVKNSDKTTIAAEEGQRCIGYEAYLNDLIDPYTLPDVSKGCHVRKAV